jgi:DNA helicase-2/ATP-dependent DNA helicase PcrA
VSSHYREYAARTFANAESRREDLEQLATFADRYASAREFLAELALVQGAGAETVLAGEPEGDRMTLSTIHQAKGLEWSVGFVLWLAEGRFPLARSLRSAEDEEEERRLFYVAVTRAADELYLCFPTVDEGRDGPLRLLRPSRFLREIDQQPPVFERWQIDEIPAHEPEARGP